MTVTLDLAESASGSRTNRSITELSLAVAKSKRIVVVTGAGISCSSGIPDFRSSDGLYNLVKQRYPDVVLKGRDLFDAALFRDPLSTALFYTFIVELKTAIDRADPSPTHDFLKELDKKGKLMRSYTQNIDGFEEKAGLLGSSSETARALLKGKSKVKAKDIKNMQLHGDIHRVRCTVCAAEYPCSEVHLASLREGVPPDCSECADRAEARVARSARSIRVGHLRPAIVLYDEPHPLGDEIGEMCASDLARRPDLLVIMGTSLKVHGIRKLVKEFCKAVQDHPASGSPKNKSGGGKVLFINKTAPAAEWNHLIDFHVMGQTDAWVQRVEADWRQMRPSDWMEQLPLDFQPVKSNSSKAAKSKRPKADSENIPPPPVIKSVNPLAVPSSPSKRGRLYDADAGSPRKKRLNIVGEPMPAEERGLLFSVTATNVKAR